MNTVDVDDVQNTAITVVQTMDQFLTKVQCTWVMDMEGMTYNGKFGPLKSYGLSTNYGEHLSHWAVDKLLSAEDYMSAKRALLGVAKAVSTNSELPMGFLEVYKKNQEGKVTTRTASMTRMLAYLNAEFDKNMRWEKAVALAMEQKISSHPSKPPSP